MKLICLIRKYRVVALLAVTLALCGARPVAAQGRDAGATTEPHAADPGAISDAAPGATPDAAPGAAPDGTTDAAPAPAADAGPGSGDAGPPGAPASAYGDAGTPSAPPPPPAPTIDAGPPDAGLPDAGPLDAAQADDAGPEDAGLSDVAPPPMPATTKPEPPRSTPLPAGAIIKVILGLSLLFILAYIGAHPRIKELEDAVGITQLITAGFPFVALGLIARHPAIGILRDDTLVQLTPVLNFGMGWLGFIIGIQLDVRFLDKLPRGTGLLIFIEASVPFAVTALICGGMMMLFGLDYRSSELWRNALLLGAAGAMTATIQGSLAARPAWAERRWVASPGIHGLVSQLDEIVGVACLLFMAAFFRPEGSEVTWQVPGTAWVLLSLGLGVAVGMLMFVIVRTPRSGAEFLAVQLGSVAFASGLAGYLRLSPIVVCFIAGVFITNFPCEQRESLRRILSRLERPIHLLFLIIAGALWDVGDWRGWVLVPCFAAARIAGRWLGVIAGEKVFAAQGQALPTHGPLVTPLSVLAMALVVSVERLYHGNTISWVMTAVIGGAILTELLVQLAPVSERSYLDSRQTDGRVGDGSPTGGSGAAGAAAEDTSAAGTAEDPVAAENPAAAPVSLPLPDASAAPAAGSASQPEQPLDQPQDPDSGTSAQSAAPATVIEYRTGRVWLAERRSAAKSKQPQPADLPHDDQDDWGD